MIANLVDAEFWNILDFKFLEGKSFSEITVANRVREVVIKQEAAQAYFGKQESYVGREFVWGTKGTFKVVGVIDKTASSNEAVIADLFFPITFANENELDYDYGHLGSCHVILLAANSGDLDKISAELDKVERTLQPVNNLDDFSLMKRV